MSTRRDTIWLREIFCPFSNISSIRSDKARSRLPARGTSRGENPCRCGRTECPPGGTRSGCAKSSAPSPTSAASDRIKLDHVSPHAERPAAKIRVVAVVQNVHQAGHDLVARNLLPLLQHQQHQIG